MSQAIRGTATASGICCVMAATTATAAQNLDQSGCTLHRALLLSIPATADRSKAVQRYRHLQGCDALIIDEAFFASSALLSVANDVLKMATDRYRHLVEQEGLAHEDALLRIPAWGYRSVLWAGDAGQMPAIVSLRDAATPPHPVVDAFAAAL